MTKNLQLLNLLLAAAAAAAAADEAAVPPAAGAAPAAAAPASQLVEVDEAEAALLQYLRAVRRLKKASAASSSGVNAGTPYWGMQQYFQPHPGRIYPEPQPFADSTAPLLHHRQIDPYTVEGFYAPALYSAGRHIPVAQSGTHVPPLAYAALNPRALGKNKQAAPSGVSTGAPYWGYQQMFTPHPGRIYNFNEPDDFHSDRVVLGGPHEFRGNGLMAPDVYRTDGVPSGGFSTQVIPPAPGLMPGMMYSLPIVPPPNADADGIFPSPILAYPNHGADMAPEFVSALYHRATV